MQAKKLIALFIILAITATLAISCTPPPEVTVKIKIADFSTGTEDVLRDGEITFQASEPTVFDALEAYCTDYSVPLNAEDNGYIISLDGVGGSDAAPADDEETPTNEDGEEEQAETEEQEATEDKKEFVWIFLLNGIEPQEGGSKSHKVATGDTIEYRYIEYIPDATK